MSMYGTRDAAVKWSAECTATLLANGLCTTSTDRASSETDRALELRARDRERKLLNKIDAALKRIEEGSYGYCVETGEPISLRRLEARPIATLSIEAQEKHEKLERIFKEEEA